MEIENQKNFASPLILVVDDEESIRNLLRQVLESAGYRVQEAVNGIEAIEMYKREPADLVIMDILMPEKEGIETIIELRQTYHNIKIIAISGSGEESPYLMMAKHLGADCILDKPFSPDVLLDNVQILLKK